jgi:iron complex transport system substrate-binding protein
MTDAGRWYWVGVGCLAVWLLLAGCAPRGPVGAPAGPPAARPATVTDDLGRKIPLGRPCQRLVSLSPGNTELLFALGLGDRIVGVTSYSTYPPEAREKAVVGGFTNPDLEKIVALHPDLVFAERGNPTEVLDKLREMGITVAAFNPESLNGVLDTTRRLGQITGKQHRAEAVIAGWQQRVERVRALTATAGRRPRALFVVSLDGLWVAGPKNYLNDMIEAAGGTNVAANAPLAWPQFSLEEVVARDPEVLFVTAAHFDSNHAATSTAQMLSRLRGDERWARVAAVKSGRVCVLDADSVLRPGSRAFGGLAPMAHALHPEFSMDQLSPPQTTAEAPSGKP